MAAAHRRRGGSVQRVLIVGPSGAGKSTLARRLGEVLRLPVVHLDKLYWRPGWVEPPPDEFRSAVRDAAEGESWVMDGNYFSNGAGEERLAACDTIVFLDFPRRVCLWRVFGRIARSYGRVRSDLGPGCPEKFDPEFIRWVWGIPKRRPAMVALVDGQRAAKRVFVLRGSRDVDQFVRRLIAARSSSASQ